MSDFEKFEEELPSKGKFSSLLTVKKINKKEYKHVLQVWNKLEIKTMKDYHHFYLKCDALLLADIFEKFGNTSLKNYQLCPSHFPVWEKLSLNLFQILTCIFSLEKIWEVEFLIFLRDIAKLKISIWNLMTQNKI